MNHKFLAAAALVVLLGTGCAQGVEKVSNNSNAPTDENSAANIAVGEPNPNSEDVKSDDVVKTDDANIKTFTVTGENFSFEPSTLTVQKGDT
ncbi:MAG: hypothetical protein QG626_142, partial [Patescibacteria group bacterium]|nr:hypothetical protein [Patescibacteria group bacterium]